MTRICWPRSCALTFALAAVCLAATPSYGDVSADPATVTFRSPSQSFTIQLTNDGTPIPAKEISGWKLLASGHDYIHMVDIKKMEGAITITPSSSVELGSYDLNIATAHGSVLVHVLTPLTDTPDMVEKMEALAGQSEKRIEAKMGLKTASGRSIIKIDLPPVYYEGQTLELTMPTEPDDSQTCMWFINGETVTDTPTLRYTFLEPGDYVLSYIESAIENGEPIVAARAESFTRVVSLPPVTNDVEVNTTMTYLPPAGFGKYRWSVDGKAESEAAEFPRSFSEPGTYTIECLATAPNAGPANEFQRVRYRTTVNPR